MRQHSSPEEQLISSVDRHIVNTVVKEEGTLSGKHNPVPTFSDALLASESTCAEIFHDILKDLSFNISCFPHSIVNKILIFMFRSLPSVFSSVPSLLELGLYLLNVSHLRKILFHIYELRIKESWFQLLYILLWPIKKKIKDTKKKKEKQRNKKAFHVLRFSASIKPTFHSLIHSL